jgi:hypothetical protein
LPHESLTLPNYDDYDDMIEQKPIDEETSDERDVRLAREVFDKGAHERTATYRAQKDAVRAAERKVEQANEFIRTSYLSLAVPYVWEEVHFWPSWSSLEKGRWEPPFPITDIADEGGLGDRPEAQWRAGGSLFRLTFEKHHFPEDRENEHATFTLFVDDVEVVSMTCLNDWTKEYSDWHFANVQSLKVGPWMAEFMEFYSKLRGIKETKITETMNNYYVERAARIDLGSKPDAN